MNAIQPAGAATGAAPADGSLPATDTAHTHTLAAAVGDAAHTAADWWANETVRHWLIAVPVKVALTVLAAALVCWVLRRSIDKLVAKNSAKPAGGLKDKLVKRAGGPGDPEDPRTAVAERAKQRRRVSRLRTLGGVAKSTIAIVVWSWAFIAVLDTLGVNVAPIIASAGVVGVALGFGAQSVVKDFLAGIFMLLEDQYGVGDSINLGDGISGEVESLSLRLTTIRDIDGTAWHVRNGEIQRVGNSSDEYAICRLQIPVSLSSDPNRTWDVIEESMQAACRQPEIRHNLLGSPELLGVSDFEPDHLSYRVSVMTMPGAQWDVQRRMQAFILARMKDEDIRLPYPHGIGIYHPDMDAGRD